MSDVVPNLTPEQQAELSKTFYKLAHNKDTRPDMARAIKKVMPDSPHAQAFADVEAIERQEAFERKQEEKEMLRQGEERVRKMNEKRAALLEGSSGRKYSEDDLKQIEQLMEKKGILDYEDGATIYAATLPPAEPDPQSRPLVHGSRWEFPEFAKYAADPNKAATETATAIIDDFMRKRR